MKRVLHLALAALLCLGTAAFASQAGNQGNQAAQSSSDQKSQERITHEVYHELVMLPQLSIFDNLAYKVDGNTVTLLGQVRNAVLKDEAQSAVKHIEGVQQVNNQIEILPASGNDDRIREQVARAIFNDSRLFPYAIQSVPPIHIIVKNGRVNLEGVVRDQGDKNEAAIRANGVSGVFSVQNDLQVEKTTQARK
jgi:osmotically-inducible protein OsmY